MKVPIALFVYNRPEFTQRILQFLQSDPIANIQPLYIFCEGAPALASEEEMALVSRVRSVVDSFTWNSELQIRKAAYNKGLAKSISSGISEVLEENESIIVLEDDLELSPYFFAYMLNALKTYKHNQKVLSIGSCNYFAHEPDVPETFFITVPDCWGWATWKDRWSLFSLDAEALLMQIDDKQLRQQFDLNGNADYYNMLAKVAAGKVSSWAICWQAIALLNNKLALYPKFALAKHIGIGSDATNAGHGTLLNACRFPDKEIDVVDQPVEISSIGMFGLTDTHKRLSHITSAQKQSTKSKSGKFFRKPFSYLMSFLQG